MNQFGINKIYGVPDESLKTGHIPVKARRGYRGKFNPTSEECAAAVDEYLKNGGQITDLQPTGLDNGPIPSTFPTMIRRGISRKNQITITDKTGKIWTIPEFAKFAGSSYNFAKQKIAAAKCKEVDFDELLQRVENGEKISSRKGRKK